MYVRTYVRKVGTYVRTYVRPYVRTLAAAEAILKLASERLVDLLLDGGPKTFLLYPRINFLQD